MINEIARRRVISHFDLSKGKGIIVAYGRHFNIEYDDLLDLVQSIEMIMLKLTGKVLQSKFRPSIVNRSRLKFTKIVGGDASLGDSPSPIENFTPCEITDQYVKTHFLLVECGEDRWENWFGRLDELIKCLYKIIKELQEEPLAA